MYPPISFNINQNKYIENKKIDLIPEFFLNDLEDLKGFEFGQQFEGKYRTL